MLQELSTWLMEQGVHETPIREVVTGFCERLRARGVPLDRFSFGGMILHPVFGANQIIWEPDEGVIEDSMMPRKVLTQPAAQDSPYFWVSSENVPFQHFPLERDGALRFPQLERYREEGLTDYLVAFRSYESGRSPWAELPTTLEGVVTSFATRKPGGFTSEQRDLIEALTLPLSLAIKVANTKQLAVTVLDTYLGSWSGQKVLDGVLTLGDGEVIDCVLWFCDLRDSTPLAEQMELAKYQELLNAYFDCTAGAVLDHGGQVLRFIGDAVMAIFPMKDDPAGRAIAAARQAMKRRDELNAERSGPPFRFGVALHAGRVLYANIGTARRLEFSVIGTAANEVARLEGLCKRVGSCVLTSEAFKALCEIELTPLGTFDAAGVSGGLAVYTLPELRDSPEVRAEDSP
jgi:adenylate cyclase